MSLGATNANFLVVTFTPHGFEQELIHQLFKTQRIAVCRPLLVENFARQHLFSVDGAGDQDADWQAMERNGVEIAVAGSFHQHFATHVVHLHEFGSWFNRVVEQRQGFGFQCKLEIVAGSRDGCCGSALVTIQDGVNLNVPGGRFGGRNTTEIGGRDIDGRSSWARGQRVHTNGGSVYRNNQVGVIGGNRVGLITRVAVEVVTAFQPIAKVSERARTGRRCSQTSGGVDASSRCDASIDFSNGHTGPGI